MAATGHGADHRPTDQDRTIAPDPSRRPLDLVLLAAGVVVLTASIASASSGLHSDPEVRVFHWANDLRDSIRPLVWPLMQFGTFTTIPLLTLLAFALRRWRLGVAMAVSGVALYLLAKLVKGWGERGRPRAILDGVQMREVFADGSLGFPSGHAAVAAALTVLAAAYLGRRWLALRLGLAAIVLFGRMYVGAHLPLDLVGGFALGIVASATDLILSGPRRAR